jgi:hypothetical protein
VTRRLEVPPGDAIFGGRWGAVVAANVDGTDRDRHLPTEAQARAPAAGRTAPPRQIWRCSIA